MAPPTPDPLPLPVVPVVRMTARFIIGDTREVLATLPPGSVDLVLTSPPFLALRSYLPADHADKALEIGSEATPGAFIDVLLDVVEACARVLAPHGTLAFELGDTYSGMGGGERDQRVTPDLRRAGDAAEWAKTDGVVRVSGGAGWPLDKSLCLIPESFRWALVYGRNPFTGRETPRWRARNVIRWCRPNPPVGCVDRETEALTPDGWRTIDQLRDGDLIAAYDPKTDSCRFLPATFVRWQHDGDLVAVEKRSTSQRLTPDHRAWTRTRKRGPHVRLADDLTNDCDTLLAAPFDDVPGPAPVTVERAELLGWFIAEGTPHSRQARIIQSLTANAPKVERIRALLDRDGADYRETVYRHPGGSDVVTFHVKGELAEWLNLHHKRLPMAYVTTWPEAQARALFDGLIDGDGHRRKTGRGHGIMFHQKDEPIADAVQVLAIRLGYRATKSFQLSMRLWQVTIGRHRWTAVRKWNGTGIPREPYSGVVWCPQIETTFWLARRHGKTFVTGNSLGDKFRPATSEMVVVCKSRTRWFDLDAVRTEYGERFRRGMDNGEQRGAMPGAVVGAPQGERVQMAQLPKTMASDHAGAPPLDWWEIPTQPYAGAHYATWPERLVTRPIDAMCPREVCRTCGEPRRRITETVNAIGEAVGRRSWRNDTEGKHTGEIERSMSSAPTADVRTLGWTSCGHDDYRRGVTLDPFCGSGTTLAVAEGLGRDSVGIEIDARNADLAAKRVGMFLTVETSDDGPVPATA